MVLFDAPSHPITGSWERPIPLTAGGALPPFPLDALPSWLSTYATEMARATQTPVDLSGVLSIGMLACAAGGRVVVEVRPRWREPVNLYVAPVLPPGERKSPVLRAFTEPLVECERSAIDAAKPEIAEAVARRRAAQDAAIEAQARAGRADQNERDDAIRTAAEAALMAEAVTVPAMPRLLADDATPEALTSLLAEQAGRIAVVSDEPIAFDIMAGRYSRSGQPDLGVYLKGWDGGTLRVDRKGRPAEYIERPALTLVIALQPAVLRVLAERPTFRGRGLLARFLWSMPTSFVGWRDNDAAPVDCATSERYENELRDLASSLAEWTDPAVLPLTDTAHKALVAWADELEPQMRPGGDLAGIGDWANKLVGHTARIAGLLHLATHVRDGWGKPIEPSSVHDAVRIARYFTRHALAAFDSMGADDITDNARVLASWASERVAFTRREAHQAHRSRFKTVSDIDPALARLEDLGWIRCQPVPDSSPKGGRPPSPTYDVNPFAHNTYNTHNPFSRSGSESYESSENTDA